MNTISRSKNSQNSDIHLNKHMNSFQSLRRISFPSNSSLGTNLFLKNSSDHERSFSPNSNSEKINPFINYNSGSDDLEESKIASTEIISPFFCDSHLEKFPKQNSQNLISPFFLDEIVETNSNVFRNFDPLETLFVEDFEESHKSLGSNFEKQKNTLNKEDDPSCNTDDEILANYKNPLFLKGFTNFSNFFF